MTQNYRKHEGFGRGRGRPTYWRSSKWGRRLSELVSEAGKRKTETQIPSPLPQDQNKKKCDQTKIEAICQETSLGRGVRGRRKGKTHRAPWLPTPSSGKIGVRRQKEEKGTTE